MGKQITKQQDTGLPAYLTKDKGMGTEDISMQDTIVPRLKIVQAMSVAKQTNKNLKDGSLYNSVTSEAYGETVDFYILLKWNSEIWFDAQKLVATRYTDVNTKETVKIGVPPDEPGISCFNYMVVTVEDLQNAVKSGNLPDILIYSASSAAQKSARRLNGILKQNGNQGAAIFSQRISMSTTLEKFKDGSAYMPVFTFRKFVAEKGYEALKELHTICKDMQTREGTHKEPEEEEITHTGPDLHKKGPVDEAHEYAKELKEKDTNPFDDEE